MKSLDVSCILGPLSLVPSLREWLKMKAKLPSLVLIKL